MKAKPRKNDPKVRAQLSAAGVVALVSLAAFGLGAVLIVHILTTLQATLAVVTSEKEAVTSVPMVAATMEAGEVLEADDFVTMELPVSFVHPGCLVQPEHLVGRTLLERLYPGECIRDERLASRLSEGGLEALVPQGMRALTLNLPDDAQVSGFVQPGATVDVILTVYGDDEVETETRTAAQSLRVLAVGSWLRVGDRGETVVTPTVTLAVQPDVAEVLAHASRQARIRLVLRSVIDFWPADLSGDGLTTRQLLGHADGRLSVKEYRERIDDAAYEHMLVMIAGPESQNVPVVDAHLIRDLPTREPTTKEGP